MIREQRVARYGQKMVALRLHKEQVQQIVGALSHAQLEAEGEELEQLRALHKAVVEACHLSMKKAQCASCGEWFTFDRGRRLARYCSPRCKQKAYRQRVTQRQSA
jgi:predicted Zn-ribbon and HTH transcriptional regulator